MPQRSTKKLRAGLQEALQSGCEEMVDMMQTSRVYEANTNVVKTTRQLADTALQIGR